MEKNIFKEFDKNLIVLNQESDINSVLEKAFPTGKLLLYQSNLSADFFDLSTLLAGNFLQKIVNYHIKTSFVIDIKSIRSVRFKEMVEESKNSNEFRFFESDEEARNWLYS